MMTRPPASRFIPLLVAALLLTAIGRPAAAEVPPFADRPEIDPTTLFLTWQGDPTTTMTIQWLGDRNWRGLPQVWYAAQGSDDWRQARAFRTGFPGTPLFIYRANLRNLSPDTDYVFRVGLSSPEYRFRTMPATMPERLVFVTGGDAGAGEPNRKTCIAAAAQEPRFALIGGDLAYADGESPQFQATHESEAEPLPWKLKYGVSPRQVSTEPENEPKLATDSSVWPMAHICGGS